jgi:SAM-dependent methyltransferase
VNATNPRRDTDQVVEPGLQWHPSLYAGSARYYAIGRVGYPTALAEALAKQLRLDGSGRLLDIGCGPGSLTLLLAPWFQQATGVDADRDMLAEAQRLAVQSGVGNVEWLFMRAEALPAGLGQYRVITFAQSFHWMDQLRVARAALGMLEDGGACVHVHATTHQGVDTDAALPHPRPPRAAISALIESYLGPVTRKTKGFLSPEKVNREEKVYRAAGFSGPQRIEVPGTSWSAAVIKLWLASSRSPARLRICSRDAVTHSKPIFGSCCARPTQPASSASRCVKSRQTSGDPARVERRDSLETSG